jgi:hypothetical protein
LPTPPPEVVPYSADTDTLHLWHLNGTNNPLADAAGSIDLLNWDSQGTFAVDSYNGLDEAYESSTTTNSVLQTDGDISWTNQLMSADGAFTWEMVLRPDEAYDSLVGIQMLMLHSGNKMQLKLNYTAGGFLFLNMWDGVHSTTPINERLDVATLGINQYATNEWFHLAVTYDGTSTGKVYWTKLGDDYTGTANELASFSMSDISPLSDATLALGGQANLGGSVFNGAIDEVRISSVARAAGDFIAFPFSSYEEWIAGFDVGTETNKTDNPDNDALNNLYELGLGGDPSDGEDIGHVPTYETDAGFFEYVHAQRSDADALGLNYYLDWSDNLVTTPWTNDNYEVVGTNVTGEAFDYVTNRVSTETLPVQFLKLIIE